MKVLHIEFQEFGAICESCGHQIKWKYLVGDNTESSLIVGSECVKSLLSPEERDIFQRRANAAMREWQKQVPVPHPDEDRATYISRRIAEKTQALAAWSYYRSYIRQYTSTGLLHVAAEQNLKKQGVSYPVGFPHDETGINERCQRGARRSECSACQALDHQYQEYRQQQEREADILLTVVEQHCQSHRFDFLGKTAAQIKKI